MHDDTVTIVGAGLAGPLLACYLGRAGYRVVLYEKRSDPRRGEVERGRSINLALSTRGLHALEEVGLADSVLRLGIAMRGRMIHHPDGSLTFQPYGTQEHEILYSVSRAGLNRLLIEAAARCPGVEMHFDHRCTHADLDRGELSFPGGTVRASVIVGADGAYSAIRQVMQRRERFDHAQEFLAHGYRELTLPAGPGGSFRMEPHALHIWPRGGFMLIALPNTDGTFTGTLFAAYEGPDSFAALVHEESVEGFFARHFPDVQVPGLAQQWRQNPTGALVTIRCRPWHVEGRAVLLGDAAHAVVPFLGQGMNSAFEDCAVLAGCLERHRGEREEAFREYEALRKPHLDTLAELCVANFVEMRDRVSSRLFVGRKRLELWLHAFLPRWYQPLYTMVEFTRIPYAEARRRARRQDWIVRVVLALLGVALAGLLVWLLRPGGPTWT